MGQYGQVGSVGDGTATQPQDIQQILAARYVNSDVGPIIKGGKVTGRGDLRYAYEAGVGSVPLAAGRSVEVTWAAGTTALVTTPATQRTDTVYANQWGQILVGTPPAAACILGEMRLPAGATSTSAAVDIRNPRFAMPYGASLGWLSMFVETYNHGLAARQDRFAWVTQQFWVPTDRHVQMRMHQSIYGEHTAGAPHTDAANLGLGAMKYWVYLDNVLKREWEISYTRVFEPKEHPIDLEPSAGTHTLRVERQHVWGAKPFHFGSATNQPGSVGVADMGVRE